MTEKDTSKNTDISAMLADIRKGFIADLPARLDQMEALLLQMERRENFQGNYEALYRLTHSLKGAAGTYGLQIITSICHAMEDTFVETGRDWEKFNLYGTDFWLQYIDLMRDVLVEARKDVQNFDAFHAALKKLQTFRPDGGSFKLQCLVVSTSNLYESLFQQSLTKANVKFSFCKDGYTALGRLLTEKFDLLISDSEVPLLNGLALFGSVRLSGAKNKNIVTILLTSKTINQFQTDAAPDYVITKDVNFIANLGNLIDKVSMQLSA